MSVRRVFKGGGIGCVVDDPRCGVW